MNERTNRFEVNLDREIAARARILSLMAEKRRHLILGNVDGLTETLRALHVVLEETIGLKGEREEILAEIATEGGTDPQALHFDDVLQRAPEDRREGLRSRQSRLKYLLERIAEDGKLNTRLVRQSLALHQSLLQTLAGESGAPTTYEASGRPSRPGPAGDRPILSRKL